MLMLGVVMAMGMNVPCAVSMYVFALVEDDFKVPAERVGDTAQRFQAWEVVAALQTRNHRLGHPEPSCQLLLRLAGIRTQIQQLPRALRGKRGAAIKSSMTRGLPLTMFH
jgi:hypothetical protein